MAQPFLDHLVLLIPHAALLSPPAWLSSAFHLFPGGRHADGRTANTLVLLADGTYLELIAFLPHVTPDSRAQHRWGREREGRFVDYAFSVAAGASASSEDLFGPIRDRVAAGSRSLAYSAPSAGGRTQDDGTDIRWAISFASPTAEGAPASPPGELPFWCLDRTPRPLRVPYADAGNVTHPSGAKGIAAVDVTVASEEARDVYGFIQGAEGRDVGDGRRAWSLAVPEGPASELRVAVDAAGAGEGREKIKLTILTERGTEAKTIGGELAEGVEVWIELKPEA